MKNSEYWNKRFLENQKIQFKKVENLEEKYIMLYKEILADIEKEITYWYNRFAKNNSLSYKDAIQKLNSKELEEFNWDLEKYIKIAKEQGILKKTQLENASIKVHKTRLDLLKLAIENKLNNMYHNLDENLKNLLKDIYSDSRNKTYYEISKGYNLALEFSAISDERIETMLITPWAEDGLNFSQKLWGNKTKLINQLEQELKIGFIRGENIQKITKRLKDKIYIKNGKKATYEYATKRLVYTESAYFSEIARSNCYKDLGLKKYQINSSLDSSTCLDCGDRDNKVFDMEEYLVGVTAPVFHPFCRCTTVPYFPDDFENSERFARNKDGDAIYINSNISFNEYKEKYLKNSNNGDIIKNKNTKQ